MRNVLVSGCCGMTGSAVCDILVSKGYHVVGFDNFFNGTLDNLKEDTLSSMVFEEADLRDTSMMGYLVDKYAIDTIIHLGAIVETKHFYESIPEVYEVNVQGSINLAKIAIDLGVKNFLNASTSESYGHAAESGSTLETSQKIFDDTEVSPRWSYALGKLVVEHWLKANSDKINAISLRYANVYGSADNINSMHIIPYLVRCCLRDEVAKVGHRYAEIKRTFLHNNDSSRATVFLTEMLDAKKLNNFAYNVATNQEYTIKEVVSKVEEALGKHINIELVDLHRPDEPTRRLLDCSRLHDLGFEEHTSLIDGIKETATKYGFKAE